MSGALGYASRMPRYARIVPGTLPLIREPLDWTGGHRLGLRRPSLTSRHHNALSNKVRLWCWGEAPVMLSSWIGCSAQVTGLVEEAPQGPDDQAGCFLGQEVAGGQRAAADVGGVLLPDLQRFVAAADERLRPPQRQDRAFDSLPGGGGPDPPTAQLMVTPSTSTRRYSKPGSRTGGAGVVMVVAPQRWCGPESHGVRPDAFY